VSFIASIPGRFTTVRIGADSHWTGDWVCPGIIWTPQGIVSKFPGHPPHAMYTVLKVQTGQDLGYK